MFHPLNLIAAAVRPSVAESVPAPGSPRLRLGLISEGTNTWPLYVAQALHFFERGGIDVDVTITGSSVEQQAQLLAGRFDVGFQQADHVVRAVEQGSDLFIFMPQGHAPDLTLVGAANIHTIAELRGSSVAVDGARTGYALLLRRLLRERGLRDEDVAFVEVGGSRERFDAIKSGAVAATLLNPPFDANLLAQGFTSLARIGDSFPDYPGSVMAARRAWARSHEREMLAFVRAFDAAYAWLEDRANAERAVAMLPERLNVSPGAAAAALAKFAASTRPQIAARGLRQVVETVWDAEGYPGPKGEPAKYMDLSYMQRALGTG